MRSRGGKPRKRENKIDTKHLTDTNGKATRETTAAEARRLGGPQNGQGGKRGGRIVRFRAVSRADAPSEPAVCLKHPPGPEPERAKQAHV